MRTKRWSIARQLLGLQTLLLLVLLVAVAAATFENSRLRDRAAARDMLDFNLPDIHGLEVCRALRAGRTEVDVIAVTSTRDLAVIRAAVSLGIVQYLLKPFTFSSLRDKLEHHSDYRTQTNLSHQVAAQSEIDRALGSLRATPTGTMPVGLSEQTLETIARFVQLGPSASSTEVATGCGVSRVTARRYLQHLTGVGVLRRRQRRGGNGRPEIEYEWHGPVVGSRPDPAPDSS